MSSPAVYRNRKPIEPGSLSISWSIGGVNYSLTDDGAGNLTGNGSGVVSYYDGVAKIRPNPVPRATDGNFSVVFDEWDLSNGAKQSQTEVPINGTLNFTLAGAPIKSGSVVIRAVMLQYDSGGSGNIKANIDIVIRDDGNGVLRRYGGGVDGVSVGSVNYSSGVCSLDARKNYKYNYQVEAPSWLVFGGIVKSGWVWETATVLDEYSLTDDLQIEYALSSDSFTAVSMTVVNPGLKVRLLPGVWRPIVPGSVLFTYGGKVYRDRDGAIVTDWSSTTDAGVSAGSIDYATGEVLLTDFPAGIDATAAPALLACVTTLGERLTQYSVFRTAGSPLRPGSLIVNATTVDGDEIIVQANNDGDLIHAGIVSGEVDAVTGTVKIEWVDPVFPSSVRYSAVSYSYLPLDPELIGLDPTRLPSDGRVPVFLPGDVAVVSHTIETNVGTPIAGSTLTLSRDHQAEVWVRGANGKTLSASQYSLDRIEGVLTWSDPLTLEDTDAVALTAPITVFDRVEDMVLITDVQISGVVGFNATLSQNYPAGEAVLSSAVLHGDLRARVYNLFHQASWTGAWSDAIIGTDTTAKFNNIAFPIEITNQGSMQERWRISFTSATAYQVIGETVGVVGAGTTSTDCAIANPATGAPYFTIRADGWGSGWAAGNQVRFNTDGAQAPFWVARTILSGPAAAEEDSFATQNRGDAD